MAEARADARDAGGLISKPVFGTAEGRELGRVTDALFDPDEQRLLGLVVESDDDRGPSFIDRNEIRGLGRDAVTVVGERALRPLASEERAREIVESGIHLGGAKVITEGGDAVGQIDRVFVDDAGAIVEYRAVSGPFGIAGKNRFGPQDVCKIGADAIIVAQSVIQEPEEDGEEAREEQRERSRAVTSDGSQG